MEIVDRLLLILIGPDRSTATRQLMAAGYTEDEVRGAWKLRSSGRLHRIDWAWNGSADTGGEGSGGRGQKTDRVNPCVGIGGIGAQPLQDRLMALR